MKNETIPRPHRMVGVEWMRGVAVFGVVCIHSGIAVHNRTTPADGIVRAAFGFVVPFFLLASFFFAVRAEQKGWVAWGGWARLRLARLFPPFAFWSTVYLALHVGRLMARHQTGRIAGLFADPVLLVLGGGTSLALYFIPLLCTGLVLIHLLSGLFRQSPVYFLAVSLIASLALHEFCCHHGYEYQMDSSGSGPVLVRFFIALIEEGIRCAPLVFIAGLLSLLLPAPKNQKGWPLLGAGVLLLVSAHLVASLPALVEPAGALGAFLIAWGLSGLLLPGKIATVIGLFSFGVYLIHQVFLELLQVLISTIRPVGVIGILAISIAAYLASMLAVGWANRGGPAVRTIFGLR